jgi:hypothetical protein
MKFRRDADSRLESALRGVHEQMASLKSDMGSERSRLQKDNGRLRDLVSELRLKSQAEVDCFRNEIERIQEASEGEMREAEEARRTAVRERDLVKKVSRLRMTRRQLLIHFTRKWLLPLLRSDNSSMSWQNKEPLMMIYQGASRDNLRMPSPLPILLAKQRRSATSKRISIKREAQLVNFVKKCKHVRLDYAIPRRELWTWKLNERSQ